MPELRITVVERTYNEEIAQAYGSASFKASGGLGPCPGFEDGQIFLVEGMDRPAGFCERAWSDIQGELRTVRYGGAHDFMKHPGSALGNCTSGIRPVVFRIECVSPPRGCGSDTSAA